MASGGKEASVLTGTAPRGLLLASCSGESCGICGCGRKRKGKEQKSKTDGEVKLPMGSQLPRCRSSWLRKEEDWALVTEESG